MVCSKKVWPHNKGSHWSDWPYIGGGGALYGVNSLPNELRLCGNINEFKTKLYNVTKD